VGILRSLPLRSPVNKQSPAARRRPADVEPSNPPPPFMRVRAVQMRLYFIYFYFFFCIFFFVFAFWPERARRGRPRWAPNPNAA